MRLLTIFLWLLFAVGVITGIIESLRKVTGRMMADPETGGVARGFFHLLSSLALAAFAALLMLPPTLRTLGYGVMMAVCLPVAWLATRGLWRP